MPTYIDHIVYTFERVPFCNWYDHRLFKTILVHILSFVQRFFPANCLSEYVGKYDICVACLIELHPIALTESMSVRYSLHKSAKAHVQTTSSACINQHMRNFFKMADDS